MWWRAVGCGQAEAAAAHDPERRRRTPTPVCVVCCPGRSVSAPVHASHRRTRTWPGPWAAFQSQALTAGAGVLWSWRKKNMNDGDATARACIIVRVPVCKRRARGSWSTAPLQSPLVDDGRRIGQRRSPDKPGIAFHAAVLDSFRIQGLLLVKSIQLYVWLTDSHSRLQYPGEQVVLLRHVDPTWFKFYIQIAAIFFLTHHYLYSFF